MSYIDGGRFFTRVGPVAPTSITETLYDTDGEYTDYSGESAQLLVFDGTTLKKTYEGSVSESSLTLTIDSDVPSDAGIYTAELRISGTGIGGYFENVLSPNDRSGEVLTVQNMSRWLGRYSLDSSVPLSGNDLEDWVLADGCYQAVLEWNDMPDSTAYTMVTFPYPARLRDGAVGFALQMSAVALQRERMPVNTGSMSLEDSARAELYLSLSQQLIARYRDWVAFQTMRDNVSAGFGFA